MRTSIRSVVYAAIAAAGLAAGTLLVAPSSVEAADGKNLKILPATMSKAELKKVMKSIAASMGVQCDYCHDTEDFPKDTEKKEIARAMMRMTSDINKSHFKGEMRVGCITCHNGQKEPKAPK